MFFTVSLSVYIGLTPSLSFASYSGSLLLLKSFILNHFYSLDELSQTQTIEEMPNTTVTTVATIKNTSNGNNGNSNSGLIPLQRTDADVVLGYVAKVAAQFDALHVAGFSKKNHGVKLCPALVTLAFKKQSTHT